MRNGQNIGYQAEVVIDIICTIDACMSRPLSSQAGLVTIAEFAK